MPAPADLGPGEGAILHLRTDGVHVTVAAAQNGKIIGWVHVVSP